MVDLEAPPVAAAGDQPDRSLALPIPDTEVSSVWQSVNVQDYMSVQWPVTQFS